MIRIVALVAAFTLSVAIATAQTTYKRDLPANLAKQAKALIYSYDLIVPGRKGVEELNVDAMTGKVISQEHEAASSKKSGK